MSHSLQHREIHISSDQRDIGEDTSWTIYPKPAIHRLKRMRLSNCEFSWTHYVFNSTNNTINFKEDGGGTLVATLTSQNYSRNKLAVEIKTQLESAGAGTYTVTVSADSYKITITPTAGITNVQILASGTNSCHKSLGFFVDSANSTSVTGDSVTQISGLNYVLLRSNLALNRRHKSFYDNSSTNHDVLARIPVTGSSGSIVYFNAIDQPFSEAHGDLTELRFRLTDNLGKTIDLNGGAISLKLDLYVEDEHKLH